MALLYLVKKALVDTSGSIATHRGTIISTFGDIPAAQQDRVVLFDDGGVGTTPGLPPVMFTG